MKTKKGLLLYILLMVLFMQGCSQQSIDIEAKSNSFSDGWYNYEDSLLVYKYNTEYTSDTKILDYETMESVSLCNKPNCTHNTIDCIVQRLDRNVPVFSGEKAYYFVDDLPKIVEDDHGQRILQLGASLYSYDMTTNKENKLCHVDGGSVASAYGWLLYNDSLYFILNTFSREYDENGNITTYATVGGSMHLCAINLSDMKMIDYGQLYDVSTLKKYYPDAPYSAECYMYGIFDDKIYFTVSCRESIDKESMDIRLVNYVTYFDLKTQTYCGEPADFSSFEHGRIRWLSKDYLAITSEHQVSVKEKGKTDSIVIKNDLFNEFSNISVFDDKLFCEGKVFDLNTLAVTDPDALKDKKVLAKYGDSYIYSYFDNEDHMDHYGKMSAAEIFGGDTP